jgi:hypothetical protein
VKEKLKTMTKDGIIEKVDQPSEWVSQMAVTTKKNGDLRICIDPRPLNKALKREHHPMPVLDDLLPDLAEAKVFSRLDLKDGYWHCVLDEESRQLTTFQTPFGRFRWLRLPFGLSVSAEIFQKRLKETLEGLRGVECIADDILVWGSGSTTKEAEEDHNRNLADVLKRAEEKGLSFKKSKCQFKTTTTEFQGHLITAEGLKVAPSKVKAITELKAPVNVSQVRILRGTVNYLARFMPDLSTIMDPINQLTKEEVPWHWNRPQQEALDKMKKLITEAPVLAFYDVKKELVLQCDASETGLGASLLQEGRPIAYASRTLTDCETRYAQIEKEALSVAWSLEYFRQYTYGRKVVVHNDHKPLEPIVQKPLHKAPRRLQGILMRILEYDVDLVWKPGKEMTIADMLSRKPLPNKGKMTDIERVHMVKFLPIRQERLDRLKEATEADESLQLLRATILQGWPNEKPLCMSQVIPYFDIRDELSVQDGLIFKGERLVIPASMRSDIKKTLHTAHLGVESCLRRAREAVFWPGMNTEMKQLVSSCDVCRAFDVKQTSETLQPHELPSRPWEKVGVDLFSINGQDYMVTVDYFSDFIEIDHLKKTTTKKIVQKLKTHFARNGIPETLISDNGPNLVSKEFEDFAESWDFEHKTTSPYHSKSNGKAESAVKITKRLIKKAKKSKTDLLLALLEWRNTPTQGMDGSPLQRLNNRRGRTLVPMSKNLLMPRTWDQSKAMQKLKERKKRQKKYHDRHAKDLPSLEEGDQVRIRPTREGDREWKKGTILEKLKHRSYKVETPAGMYTRNRVDLRKATVEAPAAETHEQDSPGSKSATSKRVTSQAVTPRKSTSQDSTPKKSSSQATTSRSSSKTESVRVSPPAKMPRPVTPLKSTSPTKPDRHYKPKTDSNVSTRSGRTSVKPRYLDDYVCHT